MSKWTNSDGKEIGLSQLDNNFLLSMLDKFYTVAVVKRQMIINLLEGQKDHYFQAQASKVDNWREFTEDAFHDFEYEAARRKLKWAPKPISDERKFNLLPRGDMERYIVGALRSTIQAHGPITKDQISSAAKRIIGVIKTWQLDQESQQL